MYRELLAALREIRPDLRVCGFTATPFRTGSGRLDEGDGRLFDKTVYRYGLADGIADGWLVPLVPRRGAAEIDLRGVGRSGGDFNQTALAAAADVDELTKAVVAEAIVLGAGRRSWLPFCSSVKHAEHVCDALRMAGIPADCVTGKTKNRGTFIDRFKARLTRALVSKGVLTTGFDAPVVDLILLLFSTLSPVLLVQILGRGTRPMWPSGFDPNTATKEDRLAVIAASEKPNCLVLDYGGNIRRHGPVDQIEVETRRKKAPAEEGTVKPETVRAKECPNCQSMAGLSARLCKVCGHEWPAMAEHEAEADDAPILSREVKAESNDHPVVGWTPRRHEKFAAPPSLRVEYLAGLLSVSEWVALEHGGYPRQKAGEWWRRHGGDLPVPATVDDAIVRFGELTRPSHIITRKNGKWHEITGRRFGAAQQEEAA
jgi:DNA repair protein RadD